MAVLLLTGGAQAARPTFTADPDYLIDTWETEDGLPENSATAMVQTRDGYLWFGTFNGLVRFDGVKFVVFNPANTPQLPSAGIVTLHLDRSGRLWVSTDRGLVVKEFSSGEGPGALDKWRSFGTNEGWSGHFVRTFSERRNGDLLITTFDGKVLEFVNGRLAALPEPRGLRGQGCLGLADESGQWWVAQYRFIGRWDGQRWVEMVSVATNLVVDGVGCAPARDGGFWRLLRQELRKYRQGTEVGRVQLPRLPGGVWSMFEDSRSNVWISTDTDGVFRLSPGGEMRQWTAANGLSCRATRFAFEDCENNLWVGTSGGGLARFKPRRFQA